MIAFWAWEGWNALVATGTLGLAAATLFLGWQARHGAQEAWAREWAAQRPVVYPLALPDWTYRKEGSQYGSGNARLLPLKNGGRGPALNVHGEVTAAPPDGEPYSREILAGPIAAGDLLDARVVPHPGVEHWGNAQGVIRYTDLAGGSYQTRFECSLGQGNELVVTVFDQEHTTPAESAGNAAEG